MKRFRVLSGDDELRPTEAHCGFVISPLYPVSSDEKTLEFFSRMSVDMVRFYRDRARRLAELADSALHQR
jgi:hypothetical protein